MTTGDSRRVALVTGGTRGIGRAIADRLADDRYQLILVYLGDDARAKLAVHELERAGASAVAVQADVADEEAMSAVFAAAEADFGGVDVVVNGAGHLVSGSLADLNLDELDQVIRVNVRGTFVVNQQAARRVRAGGAIINISSSITRFGLPGNIAYSASKAAVESMTLALARELKGRDITVNAIAPGPTVTDMLRAAIASDADVAAHLSDQSPLGRLGLPDDIDTIVSFLAGRGRWINGQVLFANGGAI